MVASGLDVSLDPTRLAVDYVTISECRGLQTC